MGHFSTSCGILVALAAFALGGCSSATSDREPVTPAGQVSPADSSGVAPVPAGEFRGTVTRVARVTMPSVVSIITERTVSAPQNPFEMFGGHDPFDFFFGPRDGESHEKPPPRREEFRERGLGSGFIASAEGYVLTNNHVVEGADKLQVQFMDERTFDASVIGADEPTDLAVIKVKTEPTMELTPLSFGDSDNVQIGEWVVAVGAPFGLTETVTTGIISAKGRRNTGITTYGPFLQTDAAINPGNSGGPLLNLDGQVVGINTAIASKSGAYQGVGFAIPVNLAKQVMQSLIEHGKVTRGWLGVSIQSMSQDMAEALGLDDNRGALVGDVVPDSPAARAGLKRGDVITELQGREVRDASDLMNRVALLHPGTQVSLTVTRDGKKQSMKVEVGTRAEEALGRRGPLGEGRGGSKELSDFGLEVADLTPAVREKFEIGDQLEHGAVVVDIDPDGRAASAGLQAGDVIVEVNKHGVADAAEFSRVVSDLPKDKRALLLVSRDGTTFFVVISAET